nr:MAG TPA: hypothetical protein [Caudoviricetes sp.]
MSLSSVIALAKSIMLFKSSGTFVESVVPQIAISASFLSVIS